MASDVRRLDVLIASPGDAKPARKVVKEALLTWNAHRGEAEGVFLNPRMWEEDSVPILGQGGPQDIINAQIVDKCDIVIAIFYHRLGSPTPAAASGTAEEINRSVAKGKPVHLYFAEKKPPYDADLKQFAALREFKASIRQTGLVGTFRSGDELASAVAAAIEHDVRQLIRSPGSDNKHLASEGAKAPRADEGPQLPSSPVTAAPVAAPVSGSVEGKMIETFLEEVWKVEIEPFVLTPRMDQIRVSFRAPGSLQEIRLIGPDSLLQGQTGIFVNPEVDVSARTLKSLTSAYKLASTKLVYAESDVNRPATVIIDWVRDGIAYRAVRVRGERAAW
jgi:hypothetical protein